MSPTRVRRTFRATPVRPASATWAAMVDVMAPAGAPGRAPFEQVAGIAASLIAAEAWRSTPLIVSGVGPQLRIYCLYGEDAILGEDANEDALTWSPTDGDWHTEVPCPPTDLDWVTAALAAISPRFTVVDNTLKREASVAEGVAAVPAIDEEAFLRE